MVAPCGHAEATVLATWLDMALHDPGAEADRAALLRGCQHFFVGDGALELIAWLHRSGGFHVEGVRRLMPVPSAN